MLAFTVFNLTDTYFVSRLGTDALAAMGFTFPIVMLIGALSIGLANGAGSVMARAMGHKDHHLMSRTATDGILLSVVAVTIVSIVGLATIDPVFRSLGATDRTLPLVRDYMVIWYTGSVVVILPPVSDSTMRAMGDMRRPLVVMMICAVLNLVLDPIMIFGLLGFPAMGMAGAALATVISRFAGMIATLSFVHFHYRLIDFRYSHLRELFASWKQILTVGIPVSAVNLAAQAVRAFLTRLAATFGGVGAVAAVAAGTRIESFPMIISMAFGMALIPVVGQNWGAGHYGRVDAVRKLLNRTAIAYGLLALAAFLPAASAIARLFTGDGDVISNTKWYLWIMMLGSIGINHLNWTSQALTAAGKPRWVVLLNVVGTIVVLIPLTYVGAQLFQYRGMLTGLCAGQIVLGVVSTRVGKKELQVRTPGASRGPGLPPGSERRRPDPPQGPVIDRETSSQGSA